MHHFSFRISEGGSQIGTSTASVVESLASINRWSASCPKPLLPTVGMTSAAMRVAKFFFSATIKRDAPANSEAFRAARSNPTNNSGAIGGNALKEIGETGEPGVFPPPPKHCELRAVIGILEVGGGRV